MPDRDIVLPPESANTRPASWQDIITGIAQKEQVDPRIALAIAEQESAFNPLAKGTSGEIGLMQLLPSTAQDLGVDANDPIQNVTGGIRYFKQHLDRYKGDVSLALSAYNAGPGSVRQGRVPNPEYVQGVLRRLKPSSSTTQVGTPPPRAYIEELGRKTTSIGPAPGPVQRFLQNWGYDPTTAHGRRNIAGTAGGMLAAAATGGIAGVGVPAIVGRAALPILGAAAGGATAEAGEQIVGNAPPDASRVATAAAEQGSAEALGATVGAAVKGLGRRLVGPGVAREAREYIYRMFQDAQGAIGLINRQTRKQLRAETVRHVGTVAGLEKAKDAEVATLGQQLRSQPGGPPPSTAGRMADKVIQGPAKSVLDQTGALVEQTAEKGPKVDIGAVKQSMTDMYLSTRTSAEREALTSVPADLAGYFPNQSAAEHLAIMQKAGVPQEQALQLTGVLGDIAQHPDTISFADAHILKRRLDQAVNWDSPAKKFVEQITKGTRQKLRSAMAGYQPYEEATKAYEQLVPRFREGLPPKLHDALVSNPEILVTSIKPNKPTEVRLLKDLLLTQAAKVGGEAEGKAAWNAVRSAWTFENVIDGDVAKLSSRLNSLPEEFRQVFYDDPTGKVVLKNLQDIGQAYEDLLGRTSTTLKAEQLQHSFAKPQISEASAALKEPHYAEQTKSRVLGREFDKSSLRSEGSLESVLVDASRAALLSAASAWQNVSMVRLFIRGPKVPDLIRWAQFSPARTQAYVKVLTSPYVGPAFSALIRMPGFIDALDDQDEHTTPPPSAPARAQGPGPSRPQVGGPPPSVSAR